MGLRLPRPEKTSDTARLSPTLRLAACHGTNSVGQNGKGLI